MSVTEKLLRLHRVDQQIRGLRSRIENAQRYLDTQDTLLEQIAGKHESITTQIRQLEATVHNDETELASIDERIAHHREMLNAAKTNKEYSAILTEVSTLKADRDQVETRALESMTQLEELRATLASFEADRTQRQKIRDAALAERDERAHEVKDRLDSLQIEREQAVAETPPDAMSLFDQVCSMIGDDEAPMAPVEEQYKRRMEYTCGSCQVLLPIETVSVAANGDSLPRCSNCGVILYMEEAVRESLLPTGR